MWNSDFLYIYKMYLHHAVYVFGLKVDQLEISAMAERMSLFDNMFDMFLPPFSEDISQI